MCVCVHEFVGVCVSYTQKEAILIQITFLFIFFFLRVAGCLPSPCKQIWASVDRLITLNLTEDCFEASYYIKDVSLRRINGDTV